MNIIVQKITPVNKGVLRAFLDIEIDGILIKDCRLVKQDDKAAWLSMPQKSWVTQAGARKYSPLIVLPFEIQQRAQTIAVASWKATQ